MIHPVDFCGWFSDAVFEHSKDDSGSALQAWFGEQHDGWLEQEVRDSAIKDFPDISRRIHPVYVFQQILCMQRSSRSIEAVQFCRLEQELQKCKAEVAENFHARQTYVFPWLHIEGRWVSADVLLPLGSQGWRIVRYCPSAKIRSGIIEQTAWFYLACNQLGFENIEVEFRFPDSAYCLPSDGFSENRNQSFPFDSKAGTRMVRTRAASLKNSEPVLRKARVLSEKDWRQDVSVYDVRCLLRGKAQGNRLIEQGINDIRHISAKSQLSARQRNQVTALEQGKLVSDRESLQDWVNLAKDKACFLDFESIQSPLPRFAGTHSWQYVPVMYSFTDTCGHTDWELHCPESHNLSVFARGLANRLRDIETIFVYGDVMEKRCLALLSILASKAGDQSTADILQKAVDRTLDIHTPFEQGWVYYPEQKGKTSLKTIAALIAKDYRGVAVADGRDASLQYYWVLNGFPDGTYPTKHQQKSTLKNIEQYSRADTANLYEIWNVLARL